MYRQLSQSAMCYSFLYGANFFDAWVSASDQPIKTLEFFNPTLRRTFKSRSPGRKRLENDRSVLSLKLSCSRWKLAAWPGGQYDLRFCSIFVPLIPAHTVHWKQLSGMVIYNPTYYTTKLHVFCLHVFLLHIRKDNSCRGVRVMQFKFQSSNR